MRSSFDEISLLRDLVATPSVSGSEAAVARRAAEAARGFGLRAELTAHGVIVEAGRSQGPTLALVSHLDTVPPGEGWTREPFAAEAEDGRLYGRGASDAKASVAAMLAGAADAAAGNRLRGRLLVILGFGEETRDSTMAAAVAACGPLDAAVVGEPTGLEFAIAQRGLMMVDLVSEGSPGHAAHAGQPGFRNAIVELAPISCVSTVCSTTGSIPCSEPSPRRRPSSKPAGPATFFRRRRARCSISGAHPTGRTRRSPSDCGPRCAPRWSSSPSGSCPVKRRSPRASLRRRSALGLRVSATAARLVPTGCFSLASTW